MDDHRIVTQAANQDVIAEAPNTRSLKLSTFTVTPVVTVSNPQFAG
jgi:hypothetical protein